MKTSELREQSVIALDKFLDDIIKAPDDFKDDESIKKMLISQGALANYKNPKREIVLGSVLNTHKSTAERILHNGYKELDGKRVQAFELLYGKKGRGKESANPTQATHKGTKELLNIEKYDNSMLEVQNLLLVTLLENLVNKLHRYTKVSKNKKLKADFEKDIEEIHKKIAFIGNKDLAKKVADNDALQEN